MRWRVFRVNIGDRGGWRGLEAERRPMNVDAIVRKTRACFGGSSAWQWCHKKACLLYIRSAKLIIQTESVCVCVCVGPISTIKRTITCDIARHHNPPVMSSVDITRRAPIIRPWPAWKPKEYVIVCLSDWYKKCWVNANSVLHNYSIMYTEELRNSFQSC